MGADELGCERVIRISRCPSGAGAVGRDPLRTDCPTTTSKPERPREGGTDASSRCGGFDDVGPGRTLPPPPPRRQAVPPPVRVPPVLQEQHPLVPPVLHVTLLKRVALRARRHEIVDRVRPHAPERHHMIERREPAALRLRSEVEEAPAVVAERPMLQHELAQLRRRHTPGRAHITGPPVQPVRPGAPADPLEQDLRLRRVPRKQERSHLSMIACRSAGSADRTTPGRGSAG